MKQLYSLMVMWLMVSVAWGQDVYYEPVRSMIPGTYNFQLKDGSQLRGQLLKNDSATYFIRTFEGIDRVMPIHDIVRADLIGGTFRNVPSYQNGFPFRLLFMPTAVPLERRRLYYQNSYFIMSRFDVGLTKHWSMGVGFHNLNPKSFYTLATKLGARITPKMHVGVTAQYLGMQLTESIPAHFALVQGIVTVGTAERNVTIGAGTTFAGRQFGSSGIVTIGFVKKIAPDLTFINQNNILIGERIDPGYVSLTGITTAGLRFDRRRHAFDLAALLPIYSHQRLIRTSVLPYGSYQIRFGK
ncbi:hypothetical protein [Tellurirhabdus bombi]|uniref:hypothetical protein n=1 Tax=Tellurirhabdus bombi TaxID=2907205 RepID=UPI001F44BD76|nr:hypothetical protein [Tellurirhabdus bombi]